STCARIVLDRMFKGRWIERRRTVEWSAGFSDLISLDFYLWGKLKSMVYHENPTR
ncbi:hypothetical protein WH47_12272, partial [Habropoda laboriosa]